MLQAPVLTNAARARATGGERDEEPEEQGAADAWPAGRLVDRRCESRDQKVTRTQEPPWIYRQLSRLPGETSGFASPPRDEFAFFSLRAVPDSRQHEARATRVAGALGRMYERGPLRIPAPDLAARSVSDSTAFKLGRRSSCGSAASAQGAVGRSAARGGRPAGTTVAQCRLTPSSSPSARGPPSCDRASGWISPSAAAN